MLSIQENCFRRGRDLLRRWEQKNKQMFPHDIWTGPDPDDFGLHRLGGGGSIMSDTCNAARASKRLLAERVAVAVEKHMGPIAWGQLSEVQRKAQVRTNLVDCWNHLRNIFLAHMSTQQASFTPDLMLCSASSTILIVPVPRRLHT